MRANGRLPLGFREYTDEQEVVVAMIAADIFYTLTMLCSYLSHTAILRIIYGSLAYYNHLSRKINFIFHWSIKIFLSYSVWLHMPTNINLLMDARTLPM